MEPSKFSGGRRRPRYPKKMKPYLVLCVDDEKMILDALSHELQMGLNGMAIVEIAESIGEAWDVIEEFSGEYTLAAVISDCRMPSGRGDEFLVEVHRRYPHVHKILLTGGADEAVVLNAIQNANLNAYLNKPWDKNRLLDEVRASIMAVACY
jgi:response regulator RpfG family c-di-GMP phosphodiesterase